MPIFPLADILHMLDIPLAELRADVSAARIHLKILRYS